MKKITHMLIVSAAALSLSLTGCTLYQDGQEFVEEVSYADPLSELNADNAAAYVEDAESVYDSLRFVPEMFYGKYTASGVTGTELSDEAKESFLENMDYTAITGIDEPVSSLPFRTEAGIHSNVTSLNYLNGYNWMQLYFADEKGNVYPVEAAYNLEGKKLRVRPLKSYSYDSEEKRLDYTFTGETLEYDYSFKGSEMTLSTGGKSVTLSSEDLSSVNGEYICDANLAKDSEKLGGIEKINLTSSERYIVVDGVRHDSPAVQFGEDGICTLSWSDANGTGGFRLVYFYGDDDGLVLTDGQKNYLFTEREWDLYSGDVSTNLSIDDAEKAKDLTPEQLGKINQEIDDLYADLSAAFDEAGINAVINEETGEIALDSVVLFGVDKADISDEGKEFLNKFLQTYTSVIFSEKYDGFVTQIEVSGHTDSNGGYQHNLELSQERADNVKKYCLTDYTGIDKKYTMMLSGMLTSVGYAYDNPVLDDKGNIDMEASRRVSFRFMVNIEDN